VAFVIPPRISDGEFTVGDVTLHSTDFHWRDVSSENAVNEEGMVTTCVGTAETKYGTVRVLLGHQPDEEIKHRPFISFTLWAPIGTTAHCSFNFEEVPS